MTVIDDINAATAEHKTAMLVHAVLNLVSDLSGLQPGDLELNDLKDLELSYVVLGHILLDLHKKKAA